MHKRFEAIVSGRVQLVMYRDFAQRKARSLKLVGEVRNLSDGTVSVVAEGDQEVLERYLQRLHHGPLLARVDEVSPEWKEATGVFKDFLIRYD
ncbi:acylphosphatase [Patescibacteria group bacterium]|nr:acylphosphatase [Patescibacteria group bacterium]MBU1500589.1 acylphosphatase [Patescibacteria group bacterium]MBU2080370.1 acylphosphatase [Patescibacteria group bacterium]MBU2124218.1 acylphosphatase [Patescibacteria group bacterium]MBU2194331.1 acylphosphatase [Patescibacteria group bacterium]